MRKRNLLLSLALLLWFLAAIFGLEQGQEKESRQLLEDWVRRTAVSCYALEGFYPPSLDYMQENYGLKYDDQRYTVHYDVFASNIMPDIAVLEKMP